MGLQAAITLNRAYDEGGMKGLATSAGSLGISAYVQTVSAGMMDVNFSYTRDGGFGGMVSFGNQSTWHAGVGYSQNKDWNANVGYQQVTVGVSKTGQDGWGGSVKLGAYEASYSEKQGFGAAISVNMGQYGSMRFGMQFDDHMGWKGANVNYTTPASGDKYFSGTQSFGFGYNKDSGYSLTAGTTVKSATGLTSNTTNTFMFDKGGTFSGAMLDTSMRYSYDNYKDMREKSEQVDREMTETERSDAQRKSEDLSLWDRLDLAASGMWESMKGSLSGGWEGVMASLTGAWDDITKLPERITNWVGDNGFTTNREVAVNAAMKELGRQEAVSAAYGEMARQEVQEKLAAGFANGSTNVYDINYAVAKTFGMSEQETMDAMKLLFGAGSAKDLQQMIASGAVSMDDILEKTGMSRNTGAMLSFAGEYGNVSDARAFKTYMEQQMARGIYDGIQPSGPMYTSLFGTAAYAENDRLNTERQFARGDYNNWYAMNMGNSLSGMGIGIDSPYTTAFGASRAVAEQWYGSNPLPMNDTKFNELIKTANDWRGTPYTFPGNDRNGVDCSHFVNNVYGEAGMPYEYKRSVEFQNAPEFSEITKDDLRRGDVIVWQTTDPDGNYAGHVAIYANEGPSRQLLHSYGGRGVGYTSNYVKKYYEDGGHSNIRERYFRYGKY